MVWLRRLIVGSLSLILLVSLMALAFSSSTKAGFGSEHNVEGWLNQSGIYDSLVSRTVTSVVQNLNGINLSESQIKQAFNSAYPSSQFKQDLNSFLVSNYAWLEGHTAAPDFKIDLSTVKQDFANQLANDAGAQYMTLPGCTSTHLLIPPSNTARVCQIQSVSSDPIRSQIISKVMSSSIIVKDPVISAQNLHLSNNQNVPYYQKLANVPKAYKWLLRLPVIFGGLAIFCILGNILISSHKRKGLRRVAIVLMISGLLLLLVKPVSSKFVSLASAHNFKGSDLASLHDSLITFIRFVDNYVVKHILWFAAIYIVLSLVIFILLYIFRSKSKGAKPDSASSSTDDTKSSSLDASTIKLAPHHSPKHSVDIISPVTSKSDDKDPSSK